MHSGSRTQCIGRSLAMIGLAVVPVVGGSPAVADDSVNTGVLSGVSQSWGYDTVAYFTEGKSDERFGKKLLRVDGNALGISPMPNTARCL